MTIRELLGLTIREFFKDRGVRREILNLTSDSLKEKQIINSTPTPNKTIRVSVGGQEYDIPAQLVTTTTTTTSTTTTTTAAPTTTTTSTTTTTTSP